MFLCFRGKNRFIAQIHFNVIFNQNIVMKVKHILAVFVFSFLAALGLYSCQSDQKNSESNTSENVPPANLNWEAISDKIAERMDIQSGEKVILLTRAGRFDPLIPLLRTKVEEAGGMDLGVINADGLVKKEWATFFTEELEGKNQQEMIALLEVIDLGIMMPGVSSADAAYVAIQEVLKRRLGRTIHFHWAGAYDLNGNELEVTPEMDDFYERAVLETDYQKLAADQQRFAEAMRGKRIQVTTPSGTELSFEIADRPVTKQDGDASAKRAGVAKNLVDREIELPAGAIRVAPLEKTVNGVIGFPDATWSGEQVEGLQMELKESIIVSITARKGEEAVRRELSNLAESSTRFREFALGFNPLLALQEGDQPWIPYYGYGAGIVRLSLGNNSELGGKVEGPYVRWNFFPYATVKVGDEVWVQKGKLVK